MSRTTEKRQQLIEEIEWQLACGQGWGAAMHAVGYTNADSLAHRLRAAGRGDLASIFEDQTKRAA